MQFGTRLRKGNSPIPPKMPGINIDRQFCDNPARYRILILIFLLYYNLLLCFIQLQMHVRLICAVKFYLLTYLRTLVERRRVCRLYARSSSMVTVA